MISHTWDSNFDKLYTVENGALQDAERQPEADTTETPWYQRNHL